MVEVNGYKYITVQLNFDSSNPEEVEIANYLLGMKKKKKKFLINLIKSHQRNTAVSSNVTKEYITELIKEVINETTGSNSLVQIEPSEKKEKKKDLVEDAKTKPTVNSSNEESSTTLRATASASIIDDDDDDDIDDSLKNLIASSIQSFKKDC